MPGAEKIGEAFVEFGARTGTLKKNLDTAQSMTGKAVGEMSKLMKSLSLTVGLGGGIAGIGGKGIKEFAGLEDAMNDIRQALGRFGEADVEGEMKRIQGAIDKVQGKYPGISQKEAWGMAREWTVSGLPTKDIGDWLKVAIGFSGQFNRSLEDVIGTITDIAYHGGALEKLKVPISNIETVTSQLNATRVMGLKLFAAEQQKLLSVSGRWKVLSSTISDAVETLGKWIAGSVGIKTTEKNARAIGDAASKAAEGISGMSAAERERRRTFGVPGAMILSEREIRKRAMGAPSGVMGPPAHLAPGGRGGLSPEQRPFQFSYTKYDRTIGHIGLTLLDIHNTLRRAFEEGPDTGPGTMWGGWQGQNPQPPMRIYTDTPYTEGE